MQSDDYEKLIDNTMNDFILSMRGTRYGYYSWMMREFKEYSLKMKIHLCEYSVKDINGFIEYLVEEKKYKRHYAASHFTWIRKYFDYLTINGIVKVNVARAIFARAGYVQERKYSEKELKETIISYHPRSG